MKSTDSGCNLQRGIYFGFTIMPNQASWISEEYRQAHHCLLRKLRLFQNSIYRVWFLRECQKNKVVPSTLKVRPAQSGICSQKTQNKYENAANGASLRNLGIAIADAKEATASERAEFEELQSYKLSLLSAEEREKMLYILKQRKPQLISQIRNNFRQKLQRLLSINKADQAKENPIQGNLLKQDHKTRKFVKRTRYKRWKQREARRQNLSLVHNFSDMVMTEDMKSLLNHGLGFVPTPRLLNKSELVSDLHRYERRMRWKEFFYLDDKAEENERKETNVFKKVKNNLPPTRPSQPLADYLGAVRSDVIGSSTASAHPNLTPGEMKAIEELKVAQRNGQIQIKPVDKGGGVALMNTTDYIKEMEKQLKVKFTNHDGTLLPFYVQATEKDLAAYKNDIARALKLGLKEGYVSSSDFRAMTPNGEPGRLYGLPKVHKTIKPGEQIPPCRPIVSNSGSNTEAISYFVDHHAKEVTKNIASFVEDSPDLLRTFAIENKQGPQPSGSFPVTVDVVGLYTNIPAQGDEGGIQAFQEAMETRTDKSVPTWYLILLLNLVLEANVFTFNGKLFRQCIGTAMGTRVAPTYACLFMAWLEVKKLLRNWTGTTPHLWRRFIDDIFFIWYGNEEELLQFINHLNTQHSYIKFTATYDIEERSVPFLDMRVFIDSEGWIQTDLFKKDTARCQYLLPSSCHPNHVTKNIPYSLAYRLLRICSKSDSFQDRLEELRHDLLSRCYPAKVIEDSFRRVKSVTREEALKRVERSQTEREPIIVTYHPSLPSVSQIVHKHWSVLTNTSPDLKRCFPKPSLVAYRRSKNLRDMLVRSKVTQTRKKAKRETGFRRCIKVCSMCIQSKPCKSHECKTNGKVWNITGPIDCQTRNVIYKLSCTKCNNFLYIGETSRRACERFREHKGYITQKN